jgi:hypothetical protein
MLPPHLARVNRHKRSKPRPTVELMPSINLNDLRYAIPRDYGTTIYTNPFRYPQVKSKSWSRKSVQDDKWSFCLTAGTLWPANQERQ